MNQSGAVVVRMPMGFVPDRETLERVAEIVKRYKMQRAA